MPSLHPCSAEKLLEHLSQALPISVHLDLEVIDAPELVKDRSAAKGRHGTSVVDVFA